MYEINKKYYENDFINEKMGHLRFGYTASQSVKKENINATSNKNRYTYSRKEWVVTQSGYKYEKDRWLELMKQVIQELREEFIFDEIYIKELNNYRDEIRNKDLIYEEAMKSYSYRFWEKSSSSLIWKDFAKMLEEKYPVEMSQRLVALEGSKVNNKEQDTYNCFVCDESEENIFWM